MLDPLYYMTNALFCIYYYYYYYCKSSVAFCIIMHRECNVSMQAGHDSCVSHLLQTLPHIMQSQRMQK